MKKKVIILGSTGSVGEKTFNIFRKDKKNFKVELLSTYSNVKKIIKQAQELGVKKIIINNEKEYQKALIKYNHKKIKIINKFENISQMFKPHEIYYSMISVSGIDGLKPSVILPKYSKNLAIVNKESIICGWSIIKKQLIKFKTNFIPIDSEHYSIFIFFKTTLYLTLKKFILQLQVVLLNLSKKKFKLIKPADALKHPNWKMGKKISVDSATLMNKVFEVIEAKKIFNISYKKISILIHPSSYIHAIVKFKNGITKILIHDPDMKIPIIKIIYQKKINSIKSKNLDLNILNNLNLNNVDILKFPTIKLLYQMPKRDTLYETVLLTVNDYFVNKFLENKINFEMLIKLIIKFSKLNDFAKYKKMKPKNIEEIYKLRDYVSLKLSNLSI